MSLPGTLPAPGMGSGAESPAYRRMRARTTIAEWALVCLLAFTVRLFTSSTVLGFDYILDPDTFVYENTALNVLHGQGYLSAHGRAHNAPLFPLYMASVYGVFGERNYTALKMIDAVIGALTCGSIYLIGLRIWNKDPVRSIGRLAGLIAVIYPNLVYFAGAAMTENLFTCLLAGGVACLAVLLHAQPAGRIAWILAALGAGAVLGLATLTRPVTLIFPIFLFCWAALAGLAPASSAPAADQPARRSDWKLAALVSAGLLLVVLPWTVRNYRVLGKLIPVATEDGITFWGGNNPVTGSDPSKAGRWVSYTSLPGGELLRGLPELELRQRTYDLAWNYIRQNLDRMPRLLVYKQLRFWSLFPNRSGLERVISLLSYGLMLPFALGGMIWSLRRAWRAATLLLAVLCPFIITSLVYYGSTRLRLPIEPYLILFAAFALDGLLKLIFSTRRMSASRSAGLYRRWVNEI